MALAELEFINRSEVVHFLGPPGTGKSHLSLALGVQAVNAGRSVYFTPLSDLVSALAKAEREGTLREKITTLASGHRSYPAPHGRRGRPPKSGGLDHPNG